MRSRPSKTILPPATRPGASIRPMRASPVTDLPEPDSPTSPTTSPAAIRTGPAVLDRQVFPAAGPKGDLKVLDGEDGRVGRRCPVRRAHAESLGLSTSRSRSPTRLMATMTTTRARPGKGRDPVLAREQVVVAVRDQQPERGLGHRHADAEEGERRLQRDGVGHLHGRDHDQRRQAVRQEVPEDDAGARQREAAGRLDVFARAARPGAGPRIGAGVIGPLHDHQRDHDLVEPRPKAASSTSAIRIAGNESCRSTRRMSTASSGRPHRPRRTPSAAPIATRRSGSPTSADDERDAQAVDDGREHVAALGVGAEPVGAARRSSGCRAAACRP